MIKAILFMRGKVFDIIEMEKLLIEYCVALPPRYVSPIEEEDLRNLGTLHHLVFRLDTITRDYRYAIYEFTGVDR